MSKFGRWLDGTLDDKTRWNWLDLWSGVLLGFLVGVLGTGIATREVLSALETCLKGAAHP